MNKGVIRIEVEVGVDLRSRLQDPLGFVSRFCQDFPKFLSVLPKRSF
jgi:hypothetical protein